LRLGRGYDDRVGGSIALIVDWRRLAGALAAQVVGLGLATLLALALEARFGLRDGSPIYLLAVAAIAFRYGSWVAVGTAVGGFLINNYLFVSPRFTFAVGDLQGIVTLVMLLVLGVGIGRLTGLQRDRARESQVREREAQSLVALSRSLATAHRSRDALPAVVARLADEAQMTRVWVGLGATIAQEGVIADSAPGMTALAPGSHSLLRREGDAGAATWVRLSPPAPPVGGRGAGPALFRVELSDGEHGIGSLWSARDRSHALPTAHETRLLAAAADQIGQGIIRDRLTDQATELEVTRRSDELKAALLESVSHDLRTPLATIRASAGTLGDDEVDLSGEARREMAREIDAEADRMARLVESLLDMSRIEGGALQPRLEALPVGDIVLPALARARPLLGDRAVELAVPDDLPLVMADALLANQVLANLLENAARHTAPPARVRVCAELEADNIRIRVEDGGPGVPAEALARLFEKFYRSPARGGSGRPGTGLGLAVARGMTEAMSGSIEASTSELGGLAVDIRLPVSRGPGS
jgi:two-component system, OmpR family, sensor histidine kinase KdpD